MLLITFRISWRIQIKIRKVNFTTFKTRRVTIDAINQWWLTEGLAHRILNIIAYFNSDHIPRDIFYNLKFPDPSLTKVDIEENVMSAVRLLVNYSMVDSQENQSVLSIHRLVQQFVKIYWKNIRDMTKTSTILRNGLANKYENFQEIHEHAILSWKVKIAGNTPEL